MPWDIQTQDLFITLNGFKEYMENTFIRAILNEEMEFDFEEFFKHHQTIQDTGRLLILKSKGVLQPFELARLDALQEIANKINELDQQGDPTGKLDTLLQLYQKSVNLDVSDKKKLREFYNFVESDKEKKVFQDFGSGWERFVASVKKFFNIHVKSDTHVLVDKLTRSVTYEANRPASKQFRVFNLAEEMVAKINSPGMEEATWQIDDRQRVELIQKANRVLGSYSENRIKDEKGKVIKVERSYHPNKNDLDDFLITVEAMKDYLNVTGNTKLGKYLNFLDSPIEGVFQNETRLEILKDEDRKQALERNPLMHILMLQGSMDHRQDHPNKDQLDHLAKEIYRLYKDEKATSLTLEPLLQEYQQLKIPVNHRFLQDEISKRIEALYREGKKMEDIKALNKMLNEAKKLNFTNITATVEFINSYLKPGKPCAVLLGSNVVQQITTIIKAESRFSQSVEKKVDKKSHGVKKP